MPIEKDSQIVVDVPTDDIVLSEVTDENGVAIFELDYGDYVATITKEGYATNTENIAFRSNHKNFTITVESEPTPTFDGYIATLYDDESGENPFATTLIKATGEEENNRKEYSYFMGSFWIDDNAVVDGTTKNSIYESSDSDESDGYVVLENVANVSDITVTLLDSDGEPYPQGYVAIADFTQGADTVWGYGVTDENGEVILNAPYGNWQLCYGADQQHLIENYEDVTIDSATETFTVQLPSAQTYNYPFNVKSHLDQVLVGATMKLKETQDGEVLQTVITDENGEGVFPNLTIDETYYVDGISSDETLYNNNMSIIVREGTSANFILHP